MEYRIFFKDKENKLKGPFTERQVQEWYRKGWFDSFFPFYFTRIDESLPDEQDSGITLASLRSLNGPGCPFFKSEGNEKREFDKKRNDEEEKLKSMEKEIAELHQQFDAILCLKKTIERAEREVQKASSKPAVQNEDTVIEVAKPAASDSNIDQATKISRPDSIDEEAWQTYYELGNSIADFVLDAFATYEMENFPRWDYISEGAIIQAMAEVKGRTRIKKRNRVCEHILVEKMKEKEFFCCSVCQEVFYNYKQALIHFNSNHHWHKERAALGDSCIDRVRLMLNKFTELPEKFANMDKDCERRRSVNKLSDRSMMTVGMKMIQFYDDRADTYGDLFGQLKPESDSENKGTKNASSLFLAAQVAVDHAKGVLGRNAMSELHEFLGDNHTFCMHCCAYTGDREGFYAHYISSTHMRTAADHIKMGQELFRFEPLTTLVNVHKKDLT